MIMVPGNAQAVGDRQEQQDAFGFTDKDDNAFVAHGGVLAVVADGMGGMAMGRQASQCAVATVLKAYAEKSPEETIPDALTRVLQVANTEVVNLAEEAHLEGNVGTTVVAAVIHQGQLYWGSVGDSRLYLVHQGTLKQLTTDHSYARELAQAVSDGTLSQEEAEHHPERHNLTSFLGLHPLETLDVHTTPLPLQVADRVLLCSDGLYGTLGEAEMSATLAGDPHQAAENLIHRALSKHKVRQDNLTAVIMAWESEELFDQTQQDPVVAKTHLGSRLGLGIAIAILLAWVTGFVMGRYWEVVGRPQTNAGQKEEVSQLLSSPEKKKLSIAIPEKKVPKEGTSNE